MSKKRPAPERRTVEKTVKVEVFDCAKCGVECCSHCSSSLVTAVGSQTGYGDMCFDCNKATRESQLKREYGKLLKGAVVTGVAVTPNGLEELLVKLASGAKARVWIIGSYLDVMVEE